MQNPTKHFKYQRITAVANMPLTIYLLWIVTNMVGESYEKIHSMMSNLIITGLIIIAVISITIHMKLGMQVIIEDYIHGKNAKIAHTANNVISAVTAIAAITAVVMHWGM